MPFRMSLSPAYDAAPSMWSTVPAVSLHGSATADSLADHDFEYDRIPMPAQYVSDVAG